MKPVNRYIVNRRENSVAAEGWVAHASRVLAKASGVRELFFGCVLVRGGKLEESPLRRDAATSTRDACATRNASTNENGRFQNLAWRFQTRRIS